MPRVPRNGADQRKRGVGLVTQIKRLLESGVFDDDRFPVESCGYRIEVEAWQPRPDSIREVVDVAAPLLTLDGLNARLKRLNDGRGYVQVVRHHIPLAAYRTQLRYLLEVFRMLPPSRSIAEVPNWKLPLCLLMCSVGVAGGSWPVTLWDLLWRSPERPLTLRKLWQACVDVELPAWDPLKSNSGHGSPELPPSSPPPLSPTG